MDDLYRELILDHYKHPRNFKQLPKPSCSYEANNPLCGDRIRMDIMIHKNTITDVAFSGIGCAICIASASLLTEKIKGKQITLLHKQNGDDIVNMLGIKLSPTRLKCALLPLEVLQKALIRKEVT